MQSMFVDMGLTFIHAALTASLNRDFVFRPMQIGGIMGMPWRRISYFIQFANEQSQY
jgi:hypothetical protein